MKKTAILVSLVLAVLAVGCTSFMPVAASGAGTANARRGELSCAYLFGVIPLGGDTEFTIAEAAKQANITHIATVDFQEKGLPGLYVTRTIIITGN